MIKIVKASAGSGKTFLLAKTYISLLFNSLDNYPYRHILAVTFTNKATEEMKNRIIKELDILARTPEQSGYYKDFTASFGDALALKERAWRVLVDLLHDYSAFSVSTIDKFFQTTLRCFAREIGQFPNYQVELDLKSMVRESVDRMLDNISEDDTQMLDWLERSAMDKLESGRRAKIEDELYDIAEKLKSDSFRELVEKLGLDTDEWFSMRNLSRVRKLCRDCKKSFVDRLQTVVRALLDGFAEAGVPPELTMRGFVHDMDKYLTLKEDLAEPATATVLANCRDSSRWFSKANAKKYLHLLGSTVEMQFEAFADLFEKNFRVYRTAVEIDAQLYSLGIASRFNEEFSSLMREKNVLNIDDSNAMLRKIIEGGDAPFVYEKLGARYENFLLDEFQDTSTIQWDNFKPLIRESDSNGHQNLIVGDVKQSIYRWRGSDWKLLQTGVKEEFQMADDSCSLQDNWRSLPEIVNFNNAFFEYAASRLDGLLGVNQYITRIYKDVRQNVRAKGEESGCLDFTFCSENLLLDKVLESVSRVVSEGKANYGQIAVLVRNNDEGSRVASFLIENGIPVISDDSLSVRSSLTVRRLTSLLHYALNPQDKVNGFLAEKLDISIPENFGSIYDLTEGLLRKLMDFDKETLDKEYLYIQSFMDKLQEWASVNGNNLDAFLKYWDGEKNPVVSSPANTSSVRIITIHKSKGLEFPYVIFPFAEKVTLTHDESHWCSPELKDTPLEEIDGGLYNVKFSKKTEQTLFEAARKRESSQQFLDNINLMYVALTRAVKGLHMIVGKWQVEPAYVSDLVFAYLQEHQEDFCYEHLADEDKDTTCTRFSRGTMPDFSLDKEKASQVTNLPSSFVSYPLNPEPVDENEDVRIRGRLKFSADSVDFFTQGQNPRLKGILLHDILSSVLLPSDLDEAVDSRLRHGDLDEAQAEEYKSLLASRIASVMDRGWFPPDAENVENEASLIDTDGSVYRPDRVVICGNSVKIIDYKFGEEKQSYLGQVGKYARLYKSMGYSNVEASLWFVSENKIVNLPFDKN